MMYATPLIMKTFQEFEQFLNFKQDILAEIVREGEIKLNAQLAVATAADQRALTISGFQIAALTALIGGVAALLLSETPNVYIVVVGFFQISAFLLSAFKAIASARPQLFSFPGNEPENWFAADWHFNGLVESTATLEKAKVEQAFCLNNAIKSNVKTMENSTNQIKLSIDIMFWSILCSAVLLAGYTVYILMR
jgi:hypothetical protein